MATVQKQWNINEKNDEILQYVAQVSQNMELSPQFTRLLLARLHKQYPQLFQNANKKELFEIFDFFLNPSLQKLLHPTFLPQVEEGAILVAEAMQNNEKILIWGDYDADGITSSALCYEFFQKHHYQVQTHVPRREQGYGINKEVLKEYIAEGVTLLISVDCGISDFDAIQFARENNVKVIVTDHHLLPDELPPANVVIDPYLVELTEKFTRKDIHLAGVGVAFFFLCQVNNVLSKSFGTKCDMREFLDLVALGTIADMMPLVGQNRILVKNGLVKIAEAERIGIRALKEVSGYAPKTTLSAGQISFGLAPRINAAGRMDNPRIALDLLLCKDYTQARKLAEQLDDWNNQRKKEEETIVNEACEQAMLYVNEPTLVLQGDEWNQGIIGIVASRMVERFYKPTFILTKDQCTDFIKGSGRSTKNFHLHNALIASTDELLSFGGHEYAAGLKISPEKVDAFRACFNAHYKELYGETFAMPMLAIEEEVDFSDVADYTFLKELEMLEPFGIGNSEPIYSSTQVEITKVEPFGYGKKHIKLEVLDKKSGRRLHSKIWNTPDFPHKVGDSVNIAYNIEIDTYNNVSQISIKIKDIKY